MPPNQRLKLTGCASVLFSISLRGFVLKENIRLETQFVLCNIKVGHAVSLVAIR